MLSPELWPAFFTLAVVLVMFILFTTELYPAETIAIGGAAFLLAAGVLQLSDVLEALANPAPLAIAAMFIISGALVRQARLARRPRCWPARRKSTPRPRFFARRFHHPRLGLHE